MSPGLLDPGSSGPGVSNLSEATCTLNHQLLALCSRIAGTTRSEPTSALPWPFRGAAQPALEKLIEGFPRQDTDGSAGSWPGWGGDSGPGSFPDPGGAKRKGGMQEGSLERKDGPVARRCPASIAPATRVTVAPTPGSALGPFLRSDGEPPLIFPALLVVVVVGNPSRAASSRDHAASIPERCEREQARDAPG